MISLTMLVSVLVTIIIAGLIFWLLHWLIGQCGIPEPFNKVARVVLAVAAVLVLIGCLLTLAGFQVFRP